jgi:hypothetical protein
MLRLGASTAVLGLTASCARPERGRRKEAATPTLNSPPAPTPTSASSTAAAPSAPIASARPLAAPPPGSPLPPWFTNAPIRSLPEYVARTAGTPPFPSNAIMLTIDDGPHPVWTPRILRLLHKLLSVVDLADDGVICVADDRGVRRPRPRGADGALVGSVVGCSAV